ncbi:MAG TPA: peptidylprolyl isomerase [Candidatus Methylacidiphilales bacterium]|jgi:parvulin-like peptidyl-prolyl isomerase|nr:peptidylprolyl isomerase [Candidatus Methylacidiphilales bacterium]
MVYFPALRPLAAKGRLFGACAALLVGISLLTACKKPAASDPNDPKFIVASVGEWTVTRADLNKQVDDALAQQGATREQIPPANMPGIESQILRYIVLKKILLDKAATMKLADIDKQVTDAVDYAKNRNPSHTLTDAELGDLLKKHGMTLDEWKQNLHDIATMQAVLDAGAAKDSQPSDQEIDDIYNAHKDAFNVPPMIRASRVLILVGESDTAAQKADKKKQIDTARARILKGEDFSKVAMEVSQDRSSAPKGGDMGKFQRGENEPGFDDHVFNQKVNTVGPVFADNMGYQFVKVTDSTPAGVIPLAEARALIAPQLAQKKKQAAENAYAMSLLKSPDVQFYLKMIEPSTQASAPNGGGASGEAPPDGSSAPGGAPDQSAAPAPAQDQSAAPAPAENASPDSNLPAPGLSATNSAPQQQPSM